MADTPCVLIAGGGIGGLSAALVLLGYSNDVQVFGQASVLKKVGAGVQISANGARALALLGEAVAATSCEASGKEIRLWNSGCTWKLFDLGAESAGRYGSPYSTVYPPDLLDALAAGIRAIQPDAIRLGARVAGFHDTGTKVTLTHDDGVTFDGDALVGADGVPLAKPGAAPAPLRDGGGRPRDCGGAPPGLGPA